MRMGRLNLINLFDFYLAAFFLLSTWRRWNQYRAILNLLGRAPTRWPKLMSLLKDHRGILLNRATLAPTILAFLMMAIQMILSRLVLPDAAITGSHLAEHWPFGIALLIAVVPMLLIDGYFLVRAGTVNDEETMKYLDRAESWLAGWKVTLVRTVTFGRINPRRIVEEEVRKALEELRKLMTRNFYWLALQYALRVGFGLTLWGTWALTR